MGIELRTNDGSDEHQSGGGNHQSDFEDWWPDLTKSTYSWGLYKVVPTSYKLVYKPH